MFTQTAKINAKNILRDRIDSLSESKALQVIEFIDSLEEYEPNEETIETIRDIEAGKNLSKPYNNIKEMMKDLLDDAQC